MSPFFVRFHVVVWRGHRVSVWKGAKSERRSTFLLFSTASSTKRTTTTTRRKKLKHVERPKLLLLSKNDKRPIIERIRDSFSSNVRHLFPNSSFLERLKHRRGPDMNRQWWFWNILLALSPAAAIATYCHYQKDGMRKNLRIMNQQNMTRILGDEYTDYTDNSEEEEQVEDDNLGSSSWRSNIWEAIVALGPRNSIGAKMKEEQMHGEIGTDKETAMNQTSKNKNGSSIDHEQHIMIKSNNKSDSFENGVTPDTKKIDSVVAVKHDSRDDDVVTVEMLLRRIQALEDKEEKVKTDREEQSKKYQIQRMNQSGIQNRIEDRAIEEWRKKFTNTTLEKKQQQQQQNEETSWQVPEKGKQIASFVASFLSSDNKDSEHYSSSTNSGNENITENNIDGNELAVATRDGSKTIHSRNIENRSVSQQPPKPQHDDANIITNDSNRSLDSIKKEDDDTNEEELSKKMGSLWSHVRGWIPGWRGRSSGS